MKDLDCKGRDWSLGSGVGGLKLEFGELGFGLRSGK